MAHMIENRDRIEGGTSQSPRTRTSSVPIALLACGQNIQKLYHHTISSFIEAMLGIAMACEDDDFMATVL